MQFLCKTSGVLPACHHAASPCMAFCSVQSSPGANPEQSGRCSRAGQPENVSQGTVRATSINPIANPHQTHVPCPIPQGCKQLCPHAFLPTAPRAGFDGLVSQRHPLCLSHTGLCAEIPPYPSAFNICEILLSV